MSIREYNNWKKELEENIKNQPGTPSNTDENIKLNLHINRRNLLINLIKEYDDHKFRESLCFDEVSCRSNGRQQEFNYSHPLQANVDDDFGLSPSYPSYQNSTNNYDPFNATALISPRKMNEKGGGKVKVYTGPKNGKYIIKNGSKVYIDSKSLSNNVQYIKKTKPKKK